MSEGKSSGRRRQRVRYVSAADGTRLAWAEVGSGPTVVKAANWLSHLEYEWESPVWRHWLEFFADASRFVRYDERGCGMSGWRKEALSLDLWAADLHAVIEAARPERPVTLLGISQGAATCIRYATQHPDRVGRLILYGGYARGVLLRGTPEAESFRRAMTDLARVGWGRDNPAFRQIFTSRFIPGGSLEQVQWFNDLCRKSVSGEAVASLLEARASVDVTGDLRAIEMPTLVLHASGDEVIPLDEGRFLAAAIPRAEFVELDSRNHILLAQEPAWRRFCEAVGSFLMLDRGGSNPVFDALSARERQVLAQLVEGHSNAEIAERLEISEKTVRNHVSNLFDKLGVWSRAQAIVFARDHGFTGD